LDHPRILEHCEHLYRRNTLQNLLKESVLYPTFSGEILSAGGTLWNSFINQRSEFRNHWMPNYKLNSGDTTGADEAAIARMVPHLWLLRKQKSAAAATARNKRKGNDNKPVRNLTIDEFSEGDYSSNWLLTFHNFKLDKCIHRVSGGTAASAVHIDHIPDFGELCANRNAQNNSSRT
jgi:hypothetical protein